ncbi:MAG: tRNA (adenosine(37)-N6)-threonylcarbamoyltransferase complex dimerization subunit type 1 TsaB, partial [Candidatus Omnitrophota bacterium]|nr:tRNA (adenosine(37)-N6)-threonylcarbamoyltransferase complex dimerization subunit type 1 TsaB [Candidatus Omnitrophota bacterium]
MKVLGVDTSTESLTVSVVDEKKSLANYHAIGKLKHSALLVPAIKNALSKSRIKIGNIGLFSVGIGPGSFTGLRVGVTSVRALAIALGKPFIGVPGMDAIAHNGYMYLKRMEPRKPDTVICPILDAKRKQVYACIYSRSSGKLRRKSKYLLCPIENLLKRLKGDVLFLGDAVCLYKKQLLNKRTLKASFLEDKRWLPKGDVIARMGLEK